jgi:hypothetical protein
VEDTQGRLTRAGRHDLTHVVVAREHPDEVVERRGLVVDGQHPQQRRALRRRSGVAAHTCTPGRNFGSRTTTFVPAPGAVSTTSP